MKVKCDSADKCAMPCNHRNEHEESEKCNKPCGGAECKPCECEDDKE